MGGYGSSRWNWHYKKHTVEESLRVNIKTIYPNLRVGYTGWLWWKVGERITGNISYQVEGSGANPESIRLIYTVTDNQTGSKSDYNYPVKLVTTPTPWGALRWWFTCPDCGRRCGCIYKPPGGHVFTCRQCANLTYRSSQESHQYDSMFARLAAGIGEGMTPRDVRYMLDPDKLPPKKRRSWERDYINRRYTGNPDWLSKLPESESYDPYPGYLTGAELLSQSGLTPDDLAGLTEARLLLPDRPSGRYRPKLVTWARKLAYLLRGGWSLAEVQAWARGRWQTPNPRQWPPMREDWQESGGV